MNAINPRGLGTESPEKPPSIRVIETLRPFRSYLEIYVGDKKPRASTETMLGFTITNREPRGDVRVAGIYYPMVRSIAARFQVDEWEMLGAVLAHEIGHLLGVDHSPNGVMIAQFRRDHILQARRGGLLFSAAEASQIRTEILRRKSKPATSALKAQ